MIGSSETYEPFSEPAGAGMENRDAALIDERARDYYCRMRFDHRDEGRYALSPTHEPSPPDDVL
jgi:hypothetical protein